MTNGLTGNQLKLIALVTMTIDHMGLILFPQHFWMRLVGRFAFPIYAFFIAEGCRYTRSIPKYWLTVTGVALVCQLVTFFTVGSLYQCTLVTFSMSIGLIYLIKKGRETKKLIWWLLLAAALALAWFLTQTLPVLLPKYIPQTDYAVDYDFLGVILPVAVFLMPGHWTRLLMAAGVLVLMSINNPYQLYALGAIVLLALYRGKRGAWKLKYLFYWYYPAHLGILHLISML